MNESLSYQGRGRNISLFHLHNFPFRVINEFVLTQRLDGTASVISNTDTATAKYGERI